MSGSGLGSFRGAPVASVPAKIPRLMDAKSEELRARAERHRARAAALRERAAQSGRQDHVFLKIAADYEIIASQLESLAHERDGR